MSAAEFKRPIELAALKSRLERARRVQAAVGQIGERYDAVLNEIEEKTTQAANHVGYLEQYSAALDRTIAEMTDGSNEQKNDGRATNGAGAETGQTS